MKIFTYIKDNSSRIKKKNFQKIGYFPLWKHLLYELNEYDIYVDTDSDEILYECKFDIKLANVIAYSRKQKFIDMENDLENKLSPSLLMVHNFLDEYVEDVDEYVVLTHVTSPFLKQETIKQAIQQMKNGGYDFAHSVYKVQDFAWIGSGYKPINFNQNVVQRTQDIEPIYFSNGAFFIFTKRLFKKYNNRLSPYVEKNLFYQLSKIESIEIDTQEDLDFARLVYKEKEND